MRIKYYLYHKISPLGLNYLGYTGNADPCKYMGSGTYWKLHIKKHGFVFSDIKTIILMESFNKESIKEAGLYYSKLYNVVDSKEWANLIEEKCDGVPKGIKLSKAHIEKIRLKLIGRKVSEESKRKRSETIRASGGHKLSEEAKEKIRQAHLGIPGKKHTEESILKMKRVRTGMRKAGVKVINNSTGEIFDSVRRAAESLGIKESIMYKQIRNGVGDFSFADPNYKPAFRPSRKGCKFSEEAKKNMKNNNKMAIKVLHKETGIIFGSVSEAARWHGSIKRDTLYSQLRNKRKCEFEFYHEK